MKMGRNIQIRKTLFFILVCFFFRPLFVTAQHPKFDKLEQLYDQGHYALVLRKSLRLLDNPEYDFSKLPIYYKSISSLQLVQNEFWRRKRPRAIDNSFDQLMVLKQDAEGKKILISHATEIRELKLSLDTWLADLKRQKRELEFKQIKNRMSLFFQDLDMDFDVPSHQVIVDFVWTGMESEKRKEIAQFADDYVGVPYVFGGNDPSGFDCSGYTSFVLNKFNITLPRRAVDQFASSKKINEEDAHMGDFVFFSNGGEVNHVGILVNKPGAEKAMIHASSSKGIQLILIEQSNYWKLRIVGYGSFIR